MDAKITEIFFRSISLSLALSRSFALSLALPLPLSLSLSLSLSLDRGGAQMDWTRTTPQGSGAEEPSVLTRNQHRYSFHRPTTIWPDIYLVPLTESGILLIQATVVGLWTCVQGHLAQKNPPPP